MAKKKKEEFAYVLVMTGYGPVFVTSVNNRDRTAEWNKDKKPMKMLDKDDAQYLAMALTVNGHSAYAVIQTYEQTTQPYRYEVGEFEWKYVEKEEEA